MIIILDHHLHTQVTLGHPEDDEISRILGFVEQLFYTPIESHFYF